MTHPETRASDLDKAVDALGENLRLLTGHRPQRQRLVSGRAHVHRIALTWCGPRDEVEVCLQVLAQPHLSGPQVGWLPAEARAVAEAVDLKGRGERIKDRDGAAATKGRSPSYHLVLLDPERGASVGGGRCAALEAGFLDGAGWIRLHSGGHFGEGTFPRVIERVRADIRAQLAPAEAHEQMPPNRYRGLC